MMGSSQWLLSAYHTGCKINNLAQSLESAYNQTVFSHYLKLHCTSDASVNLTMAKIPVASKPVSQWTKRQQFGSVFGALIFKLDVPLQCTVQCKLSV